MSLEKEKVLEAIRNLIAYYTNDFKEGCAYAGKQLIHLIRTGAQKLRG